MIVNARRCSTCKDASCVMVGSAYVALRKYVKRVPTGKFKLRITVARRGPIKVYDDGYGDIHAGRNHFCREGWRLAGLPMPGPTGYRIKISIVRKKRAAK